MSGLKDWLVEGALPFWSSAGFDPDKGRFRERLDWAGRPITLPHRAMVQARQIYVFAHAAQLGWFPAGGDLAERAMRRLIDDFCEETGARASFAFSIDPDSGAIVSPVRDAYAHAFVLFALAWLHRLNGDGRLVQLADKVIAFIDATLADPVNGGLFDAAPVVAREKRQNPHMHLLEAYLFLEQAAPGRGYLERAGKIITLFKQKMFSAAPGILPEYFAGDWSPPAQAERAMRWEPGHHAEWVWLLALYDAMAAEDSRHWAQALHRTAAAHGGTPDGMIFDELDGAMRVTKSSRRVWPHTEAIKAAAVRHRAGDPAASGEAQRLTATLTRHFLDHPFAGGWIDHVSEDGTPLVDYVPASTLYHLFLAGAEAAALPLPAAGKAA